MEDICFLRVRQTTENSWKENNINCEKRYAWRHGRGRDVYSYPCLFWDKKRSKFFHHACGHETAFSIGKIDKSIFGVHFFYVIFIYQKGTMTADKIIV